MNRILLVSPGRKQFKTTYKPPFPFSIMSLVKPLKRAGYEVDIFDQQVNDLREILTPQYTESLLFAGISALTGNPIHYGLKIARQLRSLRSDLPLVWGGVHPTLMAEQTIGTSDYVDMIVRGEGEETIVDLANTIRDRKALESVAGVTFRRGTEIIATADRPYLDMDEIELPDYDALALEKYNYKDDFLYQSNRGCPYDCTFCDVIAFHSRKVREKSPEKIIAELKHIDERYKPNMVNLVDDLYFINAKKARMVMEGLIQERTEFHWFANCRANMLDSFDEDFMQLIYESGCRSIFIGAESGSDRMLKSISKKITSDQITSAVEKLNRWNIKTTVNFISGFPGETREDVNVTVSLVQKFEDRFENTLHFGGINVYAPYPGSDLFHQAVRDGYEPPKTFAAWGDFILNGKRRLPWTTKAHMNFIWNLAIISRWEERCSWSDVWGAIKQGLYERAGSFVFAKIFRFRWTKRKFGIGIDVRLWSFILRYIAKVG